MKQTIQRWWPSLDQSLLVAVFLLAATFLIWLPAIHSYVPLADDLGYRGRLTTSGSWEFLKLYVREQGVWRSVGHFVTVHLVAAGGFVPHLVFLAMHWASGFVLYVLLNCVLADRWLSILWVLVFLSAPFGIEAGLWASALTYALSLFLFLVLLLTLYVVQPWVSLPSYLGVSMVGMTAILILLCHEALLFPAILCGLPLVLHRGSEWHVQPLGRVFAGLAPAVSALVFLSLHAFLGAPSRMPTIRLRSIFSSVFYQGYALNMIKVLWTPATYDLPLVRLSIGHYLLMLNLVLAFVCLVAGFAVRHDRAKRKASALSVWIPVWIAVGLFSCGAIYALAGGYSHDSRKKYVFVAFFVALAATLLPRLSRRATVLCRGTLAFTVVIFSITVWIWCGIWNLAADRDRVVEGALDGVRRSNRALLVRLKSTPRLDVPWAGNVLRPRLEDFWDPMWGYQQKPERGTLQVGIHLAKGHNWKITSMVLNSSEDRRR